MWYGLFATLAGHLQQLLGTVLQAATHWRNVDADGVAARMRVLRDNGKAYLAALRPFHAHLVEHGIVLTSPETVDAAVFSYVRDRRRAQAEIIMSALYRAYPGLRGRLGASAALVADMAVSQPTQHHPPLPWGPCC
jgi:hypothetical protein